MEAVKKSIYLDPDLDAALRASARRDGRSVTKQIDHILRKQLMPSTEVVGARSHFDQRPFRGPDPKVKPVPSKKLK